MNGRTDGRTDGRMNHISTKVLKRLRFQISVPAELEKSWIAVFFSLTSSFQTSCSSSNWQICKMTPPDPKTSEPPGRSFNNWIISVLASLQSHPRLLLLLHLLLPVNKLHWHETLTLPSPSFDANDYLSPPTSHRALFFFVGETRFPNSRLQGTYWFAFVMRTVFIQVELGSSQCWNAGHWFWPREREETHRADCSLSWDVSGLMAALYRSLSVPLRRRIGPDGDHTLVYFLLRGKAF